MQEKHPPCALCDTLRESTSSAPFSAPHTNKQNTRFQPNVIVSVSMISKETKRLVEISRKWQVQDLLVRRLMHSEETKQKKHKNHEQAMI